MLRFHFGRRIAGVMLLLVLGSLVYAAGAREAARKEIEFPTRPIQYVVPWAPESEAVPLARLIAEEMGRILGGSVVVLAMPGGGGTVGLSHVLQQPADGYTMLDAWVAPLIFAVLNRPDIGYSYEDFAPIGHTTIMASSLVVRADDKRFPTFEAFVAHGRANPGLSYNATAAISVPHAAMATFLEKAGINARGVPYPGVAAGMPDLLGGTLDFGIGNPWVIRTYGKETRTLAFFLDERHPWFPDIPTAKELGYDVLGIGWDSLAVRKETPEPVLKLLRDAYRQVVTNPAMINRMKELGHWLYYKTPEETYAFWQEQNESLRAGVEVLRRRAR